MTKKKIYVVLLSLKKNFTSFFFLLPSHCLCLHFVLLRSQFCDLCSVVCGCVSVCWDFSSSLFYSLYLFVCLALNCLLDANVCVSECQCMYEHFSLVLALIWQFDESTNWIKLIFDLRLGSIPKSPNSEFILGDCEFSKIFDSNEPMFHSNNEILWFFFSESCLGARC